MAWNSDGGGPWGDGGDRGPWGKGSQNKRPPQDFEELLKRGQESFRKIMGSGTGKNPRILLFVFLGILLLWLSTGIYRVQLNEQAVVLRFGEVVRIAQPGLNYHLPMPIEKVFIKDVTAVNRIDSGTRAAVNGKDASEESLALTGDENIVEINFTVLWVIKDIEHYLFNAKSPDETVKSAAESVVREVISQTPVALVLTQGRSVINQKVQTQLQKLVDEYKLGIQIREVQLQRVDPPASVIDSYRDVQRAKADQQRERNEAEAYRNSVVPVARGDAQKVIQEAEAYKQEVMALAQGNAQRFLSVYQSYSLAPELTRRRLYIETLENVMQKASKIIVGDGVSPQGVIPYLPLPSLKKMQTPTPSSAESSGGIQ